MSNSCLGTCTIVLFYCAVLFAHVSITVSVRDSHLSNKRSNRYEDGPSALDILYRNHPSLRNAMLTENMRSLLLSLRRKKRIPHHGRSYKVWRTTSTSSSKKRKTMRPPLINVNDIESPISRQKHQCKLVDTNNNILGLENVDTPISIARREVGAESKRSIRASSRAKRKRETGKRVTPVFDPIIITQVVETGKSRNTMERRQAVEEPQTTCITVFDNTTGVPPDQGGAAPAGDTGATTVAAPAAGDTGATTIAAPAAGDTGATTIATVAASDIEVTTIVASAAGDTGNTTVAAGDTGATSIAGTDTVATTSANVPAAAGDTGATTIAAPASNTDTVATTSANVPAAAADTGATTIAAPASSTDTVATTNANVTAAASDTGATTIAAPASNTDTVATTNATPGPVIETTATINGISLTDTETAALAAVSTTVEAIVALTDTGIVATSPSPAEGVTTVIASEAPAAIAVDTTSVKSAGPPSIQVNADLNAGKVTNPAVVAMSTTPGALKAAVQPHVEVTTINTSKISETLDEILESVESLANQKSATEDFPCRVEGSWISEAGGVKLDLKIKDNNSLDVSIIDLDGKDQKNGKGKESKVKLTDGPGFLSNATWSITGFIPLEKKSMIILNAVNDNQNQLATFIGECKVCHHIETMTGHWLLMRMARDCNEQKDTFKLLSDLWRRDMIDELKKKQRNKIHMMSTQPQRLVQQSAKSATEIVTPPQSSSSNEKTKLTTCFTVTTTSGTSTTKK